ncbi:MAG: sugar transferase [Bacteroidia bacterium]|nr:sugar transferase [Bacteroidia bacterium]
MTKRQLALKRIFDFVLGLLLLPLLLLPIVTLVILARLDTKASGWFRHKRIGQHGKPFMIYKIRSLKVEPHQLGNFDRSATAYGKWLRRSKLDELPQLFNVLLGHMSFVGPRPDVPGFADQLTGDDRIILEVKPGITGPATLKYRDEDDILGLHSDPDHYNRTIIWPDKVKINRNYVENWSFYLDLTYLFRSIRK